VYLVETDERADRFAGEIHVGLGLDEDDRGIGDGPVGGQGLALPFSERRKAIALSEAVEQDEPDIVPVQAVFPARVAQADDEVFIGISLGRRSCGSRWEHGSSQ